MKFKYRTKAERWDDKVSGQCKWHKWFAWYPVRLDKQQGGTEMVWLETVGRKKALGDYMTEWGRKEYVGDAIYCYELDLIAKALTDDGICDERDTSVAAKVRASMATRKPNKPPPKPTITAGPRSSL